MTTVASGGAPLGSPIDTNKLVKDLLTAGLSLETAAVMANLSSSALAAAIDTVATGAVTRSDFEQVLEGGADGQCTERYGRPPASCRVGDEHV